MKITRICYNCGMTGHKDDPSENCPACGSEKWIMPSKQQKKELKGKYGETLLKWIEEQAGEPFSPEAVELRKKYCQELIRKVQSGEMRAENERKMKEKQEIREEPVPTFIPQHPIKPITPTITCPYCNSTNTKKITALGRATSFGLFGIFSGKLGKQWHCNNCKSDF